MSRIGRMSTCERGRKATAPSRSTVKPPLTWLKMTPSTRSFLLYTLFELDPALFAAGLLARQHRLAERVLDAVDIDLDLVADLDRRLAGRRWPNSLQRDAAFGLEADVDDREILLDRDDGALDDGAFRSCALPKDSSSRAAKSSRVGAAAAAVAIILRAPVVGVTASRTRGSRRSSGGRGQCHAIGTNDGPVPRSKARTGRSSTTKPRLARFLPIRAASTISTAAGMRPLYRDRGIEQVGVRRWLSGAAYAGVARVAAQDLGQHALRRTGSPRARNSRTRRSARTSESR